MRPGNEARTVWSLHNRCTLKDISSDDLVGHLLEFLMLHVDKNIIISKIFFTLTASLCSTQLQQNGTIQYFIHTSVGDILL